MNFHLEIETSDKATTSLPLDDLLQGRRLLMIGRLCEEVFNTIPLEDAEVDPFQCCIKVETDEQGARLHLLDGQVRTECGKGLRSSYETPCLHCHGRCMGLHPGRAVHYHRSPATPTLLNGNVISEEGVLLKCEDVIHVGKTRIRVK